MGELVRTEIREDVAVVWVDNPPVNALSAGMPEAIEEAIFRAVARPEVKAVVLVGAGATFIAGADIRKFETIRTRDECLELGRKIHDRLVRIEDAYKPVVAAIHGAALGAGLELAMASHYRVASPEARVGQPEVTLGIIPGAGGTQRLPRLCGVSTALEMCAHGTPIPAARALSEGILDRIIEGDLIAGAIGFARECTGRSIPRTRTRRDRLGDVEAARQAIEAARAGLKRSVRAVKAPFACVEAVEAAVSKSFEDGSRREMELFADCVLSSESRAMVKLFFAEREVAKVPDVPKDTPAREIRRVAVVGAGTMGGGITMAFVNAGIPVLLKDVSQEALDAGLAVIRRNYESSVSKGKLSREQMEQKVALIEPTLTYDRFGRADLVVEAAFEDLDLKRVVFRQLALVVGPDCILASNTSTLDIDEMARAGGRPSKTLGMHFFSPANVMRLVEIVRAQASPETIATVMRLARRLGKIGVVVGNCFGFVANRMIAYYLREAGLLLEEGASAVQIDRVMTSFGMPVGPFAMQDIAGIDVGARIHQHLHRLGKTFASGPEPQIHGKLYELGRYGQKTGAGYYRYEPGSRTPIPDPAVEQIAIAVAKQRQIERRTITDDEILSRIMLSTVNEGAKVLEEGIVARPGDIDVIYCHGFGFPRHRGGPMFYADTLGLPQVHERLIQLCNRLGAHWKPAPLIERLAAAGKGFYGDPAIGKPLDHEAL